MAAPENNAITTRHPEDALYLCLDQGGHASRALVFDRHGDLQAQAFREITTTRLGPQVEHDPEEVLRSLREVTLAVVEKLGSKAGRIKAAGLATQRSSIVCWERSSGRPLSPVLSWQDTRARGWLDAYKEYEAHIHSITGLVLSPHYGVSKLKWCLLNLSDVRAAHERGALLFGPLAAFLAQRLTNSTAPFADPANASRTLLWDRSTRDWSNELLELFGIARNCLPATALSRHAWGTLQIADLRVPLTVVTGDQSAALFAFGAPNPDTVYANLGTGAFLQRCAGGAAPDPGRLLASVVYQDSERSVEVIEGTVNGAGSAIDVLAAELNITEQRFKAESATWLKQFSADVLFVNAISGIGSPWWLAAAESHFAGADAVAATAEVKLAAVMESIVFLLIANLTALNEKLGAPRRLLVTGGLSVVDPLLQRLANLAQLPVERAVIKEATASGLACLLAGIPMGWPAAQIETTFLPAEDPALQRRYQRWLQLMPAW
jgi:glycerol kinase